MRIALYQGKSLISRLIRWQTRSKYSHAAFLLDDGSVIEAWTSGVRHITPAYEPPYDPLLSLSDSHEPGTTVDLFDFICPLTPEENARLEYFARRDIGTPYDYWSIVRFLTREKPIRNKKLFCSEMVFGRCAQIGRHLLDRTEAGIVPPGWIARSPLLTLSGTVRTIPVEIPLAIPPS